VRSKIFPNSDPVCPCGSPFNFTCQCSEAEIEGFKTRTKGEKERDELQRLAENARTRGDLDRERKYTRQIWKSAKDERDQTTNQGTE